MADSFRIATYNLENLDDGPDLVARIAALRPQLLRLKADNLCLQEVNGQPEPRGAGRSLRALDRLIEDSPYAEFARLATTGRGGGALDVHNLAVLSRFPIRAGRQLHHELVAPPHYRLATARPEAGTAEAIHWDRPLLHAEIALPSGRSVHVVNLHLRAPLAALVPGQKQGAFAWRATAGWAEGFFLATVKRSGQALEARRLVDRLFDADPDALVAVCGDLNAERYETPTRILCADPGDTGNPGLAPRALTPAEGPAGPEARFSVRHAGRRTMLDHLLVSRALAPYCRHSAVHNEELADEAAPGAGPVAAPPLASFHAPVVAEFRLPAH